MAPATAEKPAAKKERKERARFAATLASQGKPLVITIKRQREYFDVETGKKRSDPSTGRYVRFVDEGNGLQAFETDDAELIQILRVRANEHGTFSEVPIPKPPSAPVLTQILKLAKAKDRDGLLKLAEQEEDTHQRDDVLEAIGDALEAIA
jgi:hypothetical protein